MTGWIYPRVIAHRCGGVLAPENTLAGLYVAARMGVRAVEFDVMLSADGVPVLIHDETLERTTNGQGAVAAHTAAQLGRLDAGVRHHPAFSGEPLPTFQKALETCRMLGLAANIEIKPATGQDRQTGETVAQVVKAFLSEGEKRGGQCVQPPDLLLSSFSSEALDAAYMASLPPRIVAPARALLVESVPDDWAARLKRLACHSLHCSSRLLELERLGEIRAAGVPVACYTVNHLDEAQRLFKAGVAAVFSDRIDRVA